jgi:hypothetical protein
MAWLDSRPPELANTQTIKTRNIASMLGRLQREAAFDHTEAPSFRDYLYQREDPRIQELEATITQLRQESKRREATITSLTTQVKGLTTTTQTLQQNVQALTQKVKDEQRTGNVEILRTDSRKGELQKRTVYQWWLDGEITTLTVEEKEELKRRKVIKNHTEVDDLYEVHPGSGYTVKNIIFLTPDKQHIYDFHFQTPLAVFNGEFCSSTCYAKRHEVGSAKTVNDICKNLYLKDIDLLLDMQWQKIDQHVDAPIQPIITLESIQERIKRDEQEEEERKKLIPEYARDDQDFGPQHWRW